MHTTLRNTLAAGLVGAALLIPLAPIASAQPADQTDIPTVEPDVTVDDSATASTAGDGVWTPSHEERLALIPVCSGPLATLDWLLANFTDHGRDIRLAFITNIDVLRQVLTFSADPYAVLRLVLQNGLQAPVYAINDTIFHQTVTVGDILTFCSSTRS